jgi:hypothetical protein
MTVNPIQILTPFVVFFPLPFHILFKQEESTKKKKERKKKELGVNFY